MVIEISDYSKIQKGIRNLPAEIQKRARQTYHLWKQDNNYPSLHFKPVDSNNEIYSVRIGLSYRALGIKEKETFIWFWIGSHEDYNKLISQL